MTRFACLLLAVSLLTGTAAAQQNDFAGIVVQTRGPSPTSVSSMCNDTFSCTPLQLNATAGDDVWFTVMGTLNGPYVVLADFAQPPSLGCITFGLPGVANSFILPFGPLTLTMAAGTMRTSDRGRCNGGYAAINPILSIPSWVTGVQFTLQAVAGAPMSTGGNGLAFTRAVTVTIP